MEVNKILNADILDIIFDGRNKVYGAYDLRKNYNKRIIIALFVTVSLCGIAYGSSRFLSMFSKPVVTSVMNVSDVQLEQVDMEQPHEETPPPPPPPPQEPPPKIEMRQFTTLAIVNDNEVKENERPPIVSELDDVKIGSRNEEGTKDLGIVAPPISDDRRGVIDAPERPKKDDDEPFISVQIESQYPGGPAAWMRFLTKTLSNNYPEDAAEKEIQGTVVVQFIVDKEGNVSNIESLSGPEELRKTAEMAIKKSGKWEPAIQNGMKVKSYKKQPIVFRLYTE